MYANTHIASCEMQWVTVWRGFKGSGLRQSLTRPHAAMKVMDMIDVGGGSSN